MKISLAIDNCFAMKRWTRPREWMDLVRAWDLHCVEASADNEIDPLYSTPEHFAAWRDEVLGAAQTTGVRVVNLYSGHGTYCTLGLAHGDATVREHIKRDWLKPMLRQAAQLGAGLGCYVHAFSESVLQTPEHYDKTYRTLVRDVQELAADKATLAMGPFGIEQMYSPHQIPWTLDGTQQFLQDVNAGAAAPVYITLDTGHQSGQWRFLPTEAAALRAFHGAIRRNEAPPALHLGTRQHYEDFQQRARELANPDDFLKEFTTFQQSHAYLFSRPEDGDTYAWLRRFGCYSPIVHLQQTDGRVSAHKPFTPQTNAWGIISAPEVLRALQVSCASPCVTGLHAVDHIYLTIEVFLSTACDTRVALDDIAATAAYWRRYVPRDGMELSELVARCEPAVAARA